MLFIDVLTVSPVTLLLVSPELCVNYFDTAPPPHDLLAGVLDTALLPSTSDSSPGEICNRAVSTTDLSELCCKSYDLPDSLIPALPSYELTDLPASCASSPMTNTFSQTGSGLLLCDLSPDHSDFASHSAAVTKYPWFEMFHKIMSKHPSAGPVTLVTSSAYNPVQASQSSNGDTGDAMEEDNNPFPSCHSIPGFEALAEGAPDDFIGPRVLSSSSAFPSPSTSSNPFGSPGAAPRNHLASTAFGVDQEPESAGLSSPTKKTSASKKRDDNADLVRACTAESLQARIKVEEERTKQEEM
ncbi:uncharacterized protein UHOD_11012 [Ustilago sp. UG-2017b]|nr:uncharacterized protein UHOD_11012 [Ustilago sp. UG-2017b]